MNDHPTSDCKTNMKCKFCEGTSHISIMHRFQKKQDGNSSGKPHVKSSSGNKPEDKTTSDRNSDNNARVMCTHVCQDSDGKNCSKTVLVELTMKDQPNKSLIAYAIIDEQANNTLVDNKVVKYFGCNFPTQEFSLQFASQNCEMTTKGMIVEGLQVRGVLEPEIIGIPHALSCPDISDTRSEVATPSAVMKNKFICQFSDRFPNFNPEAEVLLILGRNCGRAMATQVLTTIEPYVHRGPLGYSVVGNICPQNQSNPPPRVLKTHVVPYETAQVKYNFHPSQTKEADIFDTFKDDDQPGPSMEDKKFSAAMESSVQITKDGNMELPLLLRGKTLPDNKKAAFVRFNKTLCKL